MGLDSVELVMAFEEAFALEIPDAAAEKMLTPGVVVDFVYRTRGSKTKAPCLTRRAFHQLRRRLMGEGHERAEIRLEARLSAFFPSAGRCEKWMRVREGFTARQWPDLVRPKWLALLLTATVLLSAISVAFSLVESNATLLALVLATIFGIFAARATQRFATGFPPGLATIADLSETVSMGTACLLSPDEELDRESVSRIVKQIVLDQLGISEAEYAEDKQFVRDLGVD